MDDTTKIVFNDVGLKALQLKKKFISAFSSVIDSAQFLQGKENNRLKSTLQNYFNTPYVHLVGSGHDALFLSINSLQLKSTDEIILPANSYPTIFPIALCNVSIRLCDVDQNGQLDINCLRKLITKKTKVIILVHLFGLTTNIEEIIDISRQNNIFLIEDCAQAFGTKYKNRLVGTFGDIGCFSFYPTKNIGTLGDGGAIISKNSKISTYIHRAKSYGEDLRYRSKFISGHSRLPELQAAALNIYFESLQTDFEKRKQLFAYFTQQIQKKISPHVRILLSHHSSSPVPHLLVIEGKSRNGLIKHLTRSGIETHIHYPLPIHLVEAFSYLGYKTGDFPMAEKLANNILSLPFHSFITKKQIDYIIQKIRTFYEKST